MSLAAVDEACAVLPHAGVPDVCDRCGAPLAGRQARWCSARCKERNLAEHRWTQARAARKRRDRYRCVRTGCPTPRISLEVNHIEPRNGGGYGMGCWHHQDNLETLCHAHHVETTNAQAAARRAAAE